MCIWSRFTLNKSPLLEYLLNAWPFFFLLRSGNWEDRKLMSTIFLQRDQARLGSTVQKRAPGVYSENIQSGGHTSYGTVQAA